MKGDLRFVVPALAGSSFIPPKGGTTNVSRRLMQSPGKRVGLVLFYRTTKPGTHDSIFSNSAVSIIGISSFFAFSLLDPEPEPATR